MGVWLALLFSRVSLTEVVAAVSTVPVAVVAVAASSNIFVMVLKSARWRMLVRELLGISIPILRAFGVYVAGSALGAVTPGMTGNVYRAWWVVREGATWRRAVSVLVGDRLFDLGFLSAVAAGVLGLGMAGTGALSLLLVMGASVAMAWQFPVTTPSGGVRAVSDRRVHLRTAFAATSASALAFSGMAVPTWAIANTLFEAPPLPVFFAILAAVNIVSALPISLSGIGTRELAFATLLAAHGVTPEEATALSVLYFACYYVGSWLLGVIGLVLTLRRRDASLPAED